MVEADIGQQLASSWHWAQCPLWFQRSANLYWKSSSDVHTSKLLWAAFPRSVRHVCTTKELRQNSQLVEQLLLQSALLWCEVTFRVRHRFRSYTQGGRCRLVQKHKSCLVIFWLLIWNNHWKHPNSVQARNPGRLSVGKGRQWVTQTQSVCLCEAPALHPWKPSPTQKVQWANKYGCN